MRESRQYRWTWQTKVNSAELHWSCIRKRDHLEEPGRLTLMEVICKTDVVGLLGSCQPKSDATIQIRRFKLKSFLHEVGYLVQNVRLSITTGGSLRLTPCVSTRGDQLTTRLVVSTWRTRQMNVTGCPASTERMNYVGTCFVLSFLIYFHSLRDATCYRNRFLFVLKFNVSRFGLSGKALGWLSGRTPGSTPDSAHLSLYKLWFMDTVSWIGPAQSLSPASAHLSIHKMWFMDDTVSWLCPVDQGHVSLSQTPQSKSIDVSRSCRKYLVPYVRLSITTGGLSGWHRVSQHEAINSLHVLSSPPDGSGKWMWQDVQSALGGCIVLNMLCPFCLDLLSFFERRYMLCNPFFEICYI